MRILLVTNKFLNRGGINRFDSGYFNLYVPLIELGHEVYFYDIMGQKGESFLNIVDSFKPELIFCCLTGNKAFAQNEPSIEIFDKITKRGNIKTFNWFCDDSWRFENFSSKVCHSFTACSTPEPEYVEKYQKIGYNNIFVGWWYSNPDMYPANKKSIDIGFCGRINEQRASAFNFLKSKNINIQVQSGVSYEDMLLLYSLSKIGINFSVNENNGKTQMKLRMVEIPASGAALLTEYTPGIEEFFELDKEIFTFSSNKEMIQKANFLMKNEKLRDEVAQKGYRRFLKDHTSKERLSKILQKIKKL